MADSKISALPGATTPLAGTEVVPVVQSGVTKNVSVANLTAGRDVSVNKLTAASTIAMSYGQEITAASEATPANNTIVKNAYDANGNDTLYLKPAGASGTGQIVFQNRTGGEFARFGGSDFLPQGSVVPTAAKGVNFTANTPAAGMTSQLLNWYEEGTWTPTVEGSTSNPTITYSAGDTGGFYTRIGNIVYVTFEVRWSSISGGSGNVQIAGLPFARKASAQPNGDRFAVESRGVTYTGDSLIAQVSQTFQYMTLFSNDQAGGAGYFLQCSGLGTVTVGYIRGTGFYYV